jgi:tripeptide aminopeptidase
MIRKERLVNTFLELVQIDAPSGGERELAERVAEKFQKMGLAVHLDELHNVKAVLDGRGKPLLLSAHTDRVEPGRGVKPVIEAGVIKSDGTTVLGADDLAGVSAILEGTQSILEDGAAHLPLEIVISSQEETGLVGAKGIDLSGFEAEEGIVLDSSGPVGGITLASPSHNLINATITGRAAHSGTAPEQGIDAIRVAARAISKMKLGRIDKETTANIGIIRGGSARNIVPEKVELMGEARSRSLRKLERQTRAMKKALERAGKPYAAKVQVHIERAYNQYKFGKRDRLVKKVANALERVERTPRYGSSGGGSDANIYNAKRLKCVVVSVGYEQIHTTNEYIPIAELVKSAELVAVLAAG